jgi:hypothetical protein
MSLDAIMGTFVSIKTMADGTPRIILDLQCGLADVAAMGLIPGVPFGIARIAKEGSAKPVAAPQEPKERPGQLCVMAVTFCADKAFWHWIERVHNLDCSSEEEAKGFVLETCNIDSRKELDTNRAAADAFHQQVRRPFLAWRDAQ